MSHRKISYCGPKQTTIGSPDGLTRYHYEITGNGRIRRTRYEGDMQKREHDWNRVRSEIISFTTAQAHYRDLIKVKRWVRV